MEENQSYYLQETADLHVHQHMTVYVCKRYRHVILIKQEDSTLDLYMSQQPHFNG